MSLQACANLVARADPERFSAAMAAPVAARAVLLPVYAASIEVARAPWLTQEPMIAEMRLQWWRDAFEEIETGRPRKHEVVDALAPVLGPKGAAALDAMVLARRWDIYKEGFNTAADVLAHVRTITLGPMLAALEALDHLPEDLSALHAHATQLGLARFLRGVPALIERKTPVWAEDQKVQIYRESLYPSARYDARFYPLTSVDRNRLLSQDVRVRPKKSGGRRGRGNSGVSHWRDPRTGVARLALRIKSV